MAATRGAAREAGKLLIHLTIDDICKMLNMKDTGDDPKYASGEGRGGGR